MTEKYAEFDNVDKAPIVPDIKIRNHSFKVTELALGLLAFVAITVCIILASVLASKDSSSDKPSTSALTGNGLNLCEDESCVRSAYYAISNMNKTIDPCDNFYQYACGGFRKRHPLDIETASLTVYSNMYQENEDKLKKILESPVNRNTDDSSERKLKHYFESCTNTYLKERAKGSPIINKIIPQVGGWYVLGNWNSATYNFQNAFQKVSIDFWTAAFYTFRYATDWFDWNKRVIELDYAGMSMYWYFYVEESLEKYRTDLKKFMRKTANLIVRDSNITMDNATKSQRIEQFIEDAFMIEYNLANITANTVPTPDPHNHEKRVAINDLNSVLGSAIDFKSHVLYMFDNANVNGNTKIVLREADWLQRVATMIDGLGANKARILNNYLMWRVFDRYDQEMSWEYVHANREFYVDRYGIPQFLGTWYYCFYNVDRYLGDALSSLYVRDHFVDGNKDKAHEILDVVKEALAESTAANTFMDQQTKDIAKEKMKNSLDKLGYPDFMMNDDGMDNLYAALDVSTDDYFQNLLNVNAYIKKDWNKKLRNHVNKQEEWVYRTYDTTMTYYGPWNELLIPAGLLQFPIYDQSLPHFVNFGTMGSLMAHYLIHAIDNYGRYYDKNGALNEWWSNKTMESYTKTRTCVDNYYGNQTMGPFQVPGETLPVTVPVNGYSFSAEGMAITSGVQIAYQAYQKWIQRNYIEKEAPGLRLSNDQTFFLSFAQSWCYNRKDNVAYDNAVRGVVAEDIRVNGAVSQLDEFARAYNCPVGSKMNPKNKCRMYS